MAKMMEIGFMLLAVDKLSGPLGKATGNLAKFSAVAKSFSTSMAGLGMNSGLLAESMRKLSQSSLQAFVEQDDAFNQLRITMLRAGGAGLEKLQEMEKLITKIGNDYPGTTADFALLADTLQKGEISAENVLGGALQAAADLSVIMRMVPKDAGVMVAAMTKGYGLAAHELKKMADMTQRVSFGFGVSADDFKEGTAYVAGQANRLGITGEKGASDMLLVQGMAQQRSIKGSQYGTNMAEFLKNSAELKHKLGKHSRQAAELREMLSAKGVRMDFFDKSGTFAGIPNMFYQLQKLKVFNQEQRQHIMEKLFGEQGGRLADVFFQEGIEGYKKAQAKIKEQASLDERIAERLKAAKNVVESLTGTWTNLQAAFGQPVFEALDPWIKQLNTFLGGPVQDWVEQNKELVKWVGLGALGIGGLSLALGGLAIALSLAARGWLMVWGGLKLLLAPFGLLLKLVILLCRWMIGPLRFAFIALRIVGIGLYVVMRALPALLKGFATALWLTAKALLRGAWAALRFAGALLANPLTWIIAGIITLGVLIYWIATRWDFVKERWGMVFDSIGNVFKAIWGLIKFKTHEGIEWLKSRFDELVNWVSGLATRFLEAGRKIATSIGDGMRSGWDYVKSGANKLASGIMNHYPQSPAKEGPLRNLSKVHIAEELAKSLRPMALLGPVRNLANQVQQTLNPGLMLGGSAFAPGLRLAPSAAPVLASGGGRPVVNAPLSLTINGNLTQEAAEDFRDQLRRHAAVIENIMSSFSRRESKLSFKDN